MLGALFGFAFLLFMVVVVPLLALRLIFGLAMGLLLLPFKLLGAALRVVFGLLGVVFKVVFTGAGILAGLLALVLAVVLVPLLPLLLVGFVFWAFVRLFSRPALARA